MGAEFEAILKSLSLFTFCNPTDNFDVGVDGVG